MPRPRSTRLILTRASSGLGMIVTVRVVVQPAAMANRTANVTWIGRVAVLMSALMLLPPSSRGERRPRRGSSPGEHERAVLAAERDAVAQCDVDVRRPRA